MYFISMQKYSDTELDRDAQPNIQVMKLIDKDYLPSVSEHKVTNDSRIQCLENDLHRPRKEIQECKAICEDPSRSLPAASE